jgi:hypothetical protein
VTETSIRQITSATISFNQQKDRLQCTRFHLFAPDPREHHLPAVLTLAADSHSLTSAATRFAKSDTIHYLSRQKQTKHSRR